MENSLEYLNLVLSSFTNINHKGVTEILISIYRLKKLKELKLNFSDLNLPSKIFDKLELWPEVKNLSLG